MIKTAVIKHCGEKHFLRYALCASHHACACSQRRSSSTDDSLTRLISRGKTIIKRFVERKHSALSAAIICSALISHVTDPIPNFSKSSSWASISSMSKSSLATEIRAAKRSPSAKSAARDWPGTKRSMAYILHRQSALPWHRDCLPAGHRRYPIHG